MSNPTKICSKCKTEKPATKQFFDADKRNSDGLFGYCKVCKAEYNKLHRKPNKTKENYKEHTDPVRSAPPKLPSIGEMVKIRQRMGRDNHADITKSYVIRKGEVVDITSTIVLIQGEHYKEAINLFDILTGEVRLEAVG